MRPLTDRRKTPWWEALLVFILFTAVMLLLELRAGAEIALGPDAELYLSIADNFLSTGHFIQTARGSQAMVVPFGTPLILTVFRLAGLSAAGIVRSQYAVVGLSCLFLYLAEKNWFRWGGAAPVIFMAALRYKRFYITNIMVEYWYLLCLCAILWLISEIVMNGKKTAARFALLCAVGFLAVTIRPVLLPVYVGILLFSAAYARKERGIRRAVILTVAVSCLVLGVNLLSNHRETGYWILMENYSGEDICVANNPNTSTSGYSYYRRDSYTTEEIQALRDDPTLDKTQKDARFREMAREYILSHPKETLRNTWGKLVILFIKYWLAVPVAALFCGLGLVLFRPGERWVHAGEIVVFLVIAVVTSMGLNVRRYAYPIWPVASLHLSAGLHCGLYWLFRVLLPRLRGREPGAPGRE